MNFWFLTLIILTPLIISIIFIIIGKQSAKNEEDKKVKDNLIITAYVFGIPYLLVGTFILLKTHFIKDNNSPISSTSTQSDGFFTQNIQNIIDLQKKVQNLKIKI